MESARVLYRISVTKLRSISLVKTTRNSYFKRWKPKLFSSRFQLFFRRLVFCCTSFFRTVLTFMSVLLLHNTFEMEVWSEAVIDRACERACEWCKWLLRITVASIKSNITKLVEPTKSENNHKDGVATTVAAVAVPPRHTSTQMCGWKAYKHKKNRTRNKKIAWMNEWKTRKKTNEKKRQSGKSS